MRLIYLETCLPDYFQGHSGHVYAVPITNDSTYKTVMRDLMAEISDKEIQDAQESDYDAITESARKIFSACNMDDVFQKLLDPYDDSETVYAYFGVIAGKD